MAVVDAADTPDRRHGPGRAVAVLVVGVVVTVLGVWLVARHPVSIGWFAYAPLSEQTYAPGPPWQRGAGTALAVVGLLVVGGAVGYLLGRRAR